jgi:hypothetical protein
MASDRYGSDRYADDPERQRVYINGLPARGHVFRRYLGAHPVDEDGHCMCGAYGPGCPGQDRAARIDFSNSLIDK